MLTPADQQHRDCARLRLDANVVVEAGAGTGKTSLLVDRILFLILGARGGAPIPVTGVVALTFTEKAAGEIKLRLADRLVEVLSVLSGGKGARAEAFIAELRRVFGRSDDEIAACARESLEKLDRASIGTIHSFAAQLLRLYPIEAGVDPGFRVDEGDAFDELFASEWAAWLDVELGERAPRGAEWRAVLRLASLDDLEALARALCGEGLEADRAGLPDPATADWLESLACRLDEAPREQPKPRSNSRILQSLKEVSGRLRALAQAARQGALEAPAVLGAQAPRASTWPKDWDTREAAAYEQGLAIAEKATPEAEALLRRSCALVRPFAASFRQAYARRGLVSFDGLLRKARDLVRDHHAVREKLKREFLALLIDEFQDTDPLQGELLLYLAEAEGRCAKRWQEARLGPGRLFVVGDPKQSIYRFRGADIAAYQSFTEKILSGVGALHCALTTNFRSPEELLTPVNAIFAPLMWEEAGLQAGYKPLGSARKGDGEAAVELVPFVPAEGGKPLAAAAQQAAEAAWIGDWIRDRCGPGKERRFKDVAVLLKTSAPLAALLDAFKERGIPYAVEMERFFYGAQEVVDFLNLLKALDDPEDPLSLAALLRSPLAALEDAHLYSLARGGGLDYRRAPSKGVPEKALARVSELYSTLRELRTGVGRRPLGELVREILERTCLLEVCARAYHGQQTAANLTKFARMAATASDEKGMTLGEFIGRVAFEMEAGRNEGENPLADEHLEAVRVMTVHKSKGLEFPIVFLANASGGRGGGRPPVALQDWASGRVGVRLPGAGACDAAMARLLVEESVRQEHETLRLLYVALTRARERLYVLGAHEGDKNSLSTRLAAAGAWPGEEPRSGLIRLEGAAPIRVTVAAAEPGKAAPTVAPPTPAAPAPEPSFMGRRWEDRERRLEDALKRSWITRPTDGLEPAKETPREAEETFSRARSSLVGSLCHAALERWDYRGGGDVAQAVERARSRLCRLDPSADWDAAQREAQDILRSFTSSSAARELASLEILGRELPFVYAQDGAVMRGTLDLLYRKGARLVVADYKTGAVTPATLEAKRAEYERQGRAYCEAVRRALGADKVEFRLIFLRAPDLA